MSGEAVTLSLDQIGLMLLYMREGLEKDYIDAVGEALAQLDSALFGIEAIAELGVGYIGPAPRGGVVEMPSVEGHMTAFALAAKRISRMGVLKQDVMPEVPGVGAPPPEPV